VWTVLSGPTGTTTTKSLTVSLGQNDLGDDGKSIRNQLEERAYPRDRESPGHSAYHDFSLERVVGRCRAVGSLARHVKRKGSATVERKKQNANQRRQKKVSDRLQRVFSTQHNRRLERYILQVPTKRNQTYDLPVGKDMRPCNVRCKAVIVQTSIRHCVGHHYIGFFRGRGQNFQRWRVAGRRILYSLVLTLAM
jgi:hypothetical protein